MTDVSSVGDANKGILTDFDTIFDSWWGILNKVKPEESTLVLKDEIYWYHRVCNETLTLPNIMFKALYSKRGKILTKDNLKLTNILSFIYTEVLALEQIKIESGGLSPVVIDINIYPYKFTIMELKIIKKILENLLLGPNLTINFINIPLWNLELKKIKNRYRSFISVNGLEWLGYNTLTKTYSNLNLFIPSLYEEPPIYEITPEIQERDFNFLEIFTKPVVNLKTLPVSLFCRKLKKE